MAGTGSGAAAPPYRYGKVGVAAAPQLFERPRHNLTLGRHPAFETKDVMPVNTMLGYLQTGLGIAVSVFLFLVGYRQTVGARKERARAASSTLKRALLRRLVSEGYTPSLEDVGLLLSAKARDVAVSSDDLSTPDQLLEALYVEVFESELITGTQREELTRRLLTALRPPASAPARAIVRAEMLSESVSVGRLPRYSTGVMALIATTGGALVTLLATLRSGTSSTLIALGSAGIALLGGAAAILAIEFLRQSRRSGGEPDIRPPATSAAEFEWKIARALEEAGLDYELNASAGSAQVDFLLRHGKSTAIVEARQWRRTIPLSAVSLTLELVRYMRSEAKADHAFVVVPDVRALPRSVREREGVAIVSTEELLARLKAWKVTSEAA